MVPSTCTHTHAHDVSLLCTVYDRTRALNSCDIVDLCIRGTGNAPNLALVQSGSVLFVGCWASIV